MGFGEKPSANLAATRRKLRWHGVLGLFLMLPGCASQPDETHPRPVDGTDEKEAIAKVAFAIVKGLAAGRSTRAIVTLDRTHIEQDARLPAVTQGREGLVKRFKEQVRLHAQAKKSLVTEMAGRGLTVERDYPHLPVALVRIDSNEALMALARHPHVKAIGEDLEVTPFLDSSLPYIHQPVAKAEGEVGAGTSVAIIDSGITFANEAFGPCSAPGVTTSGALVPCKVGLTIPFRPETPSTELSRRHGTHVAATVLGVAPGAQVLDLDVFGNNRSTGTSSLLSALDWVLAHEAEYNIASINMSLGGGLFDSSCDQSSLTEAIQRARDLGIVTAVASGNDGSITGVSYPACTPGAVVVGASDETPSPGTVASFSNSSPLVTLWAPGVSITAAGYTLSGTSMATPHVAGAIALLRGAFQDDSADQLQTRLLSYGVALRDERNTITKPRLDLEAFPKGCPLSVTPSKRFVGTGPSTIRLAIATPSGCSWSVGSSDAWITFPGSTEGTGPGSVEGILADNLGETRQGKILVRGQFFSKYVPVSQGPSRGTVTINGGAPFAQSPSVVLSITPAAGTSFSEMCISNTESCSNYESLAPTKTWNLTQDALGTDGPKTVYAFFKDSAGLTTPVVNAGRGTIVLDRTPPADGRLQTDAPPNQRTVTLRWTGFQDYGSGLAGYKLVQSLGTAPASCASGTLLFQGNATSFTHPNVAAGTKYGYRLCAVDAAGNVSPGVTATATSVVDNAGHVGKIVIEEGKAYTKSRRVAVSLNATDPSGVTKMCLSESASCTAWVPFAATTTFVLGAAQGNHTLKVWFEDALGNRSATPAVDTIVFDSVAPSLPSLQGAASRTVASLQWPTATDAQAGMAFYKVVYQLGQTLPAAQCTNGTPRHANLATTLNIAALQPGRTYSFRVCATDRAGNTSTGAILRLTTKP